PSSGHLSPMKQIQFSMPSGSKQSESGNDASIIDGGRNSAATSSKLLLVGPRLVPAHQLRSKLLAVHCGYHAGQQADRRRRQDVSWLSQEVLSSRSFLRAPPTVGNIFAAEPVS